MANGSVLIVLLVLCSSSLCISSVASAGGVLVTRPMEGDTCIGDDENAESIVNEGECAFVSCASGYELNSDGVCAIPIPTRGTREGFMKTDKAIVGSGIITMGPPVNQVAKEGFMAPGSVTVPGTLEVGRIPPCIEGEEKRAGLCYIRPPVSLEAKLGLLPPP